MSGPVHAAGGIVIRRDPAGLALVAVVHRPKYDDWTFPKGKLRAGETHEQAALREVREETGQRCLLDDELASTRYLDPAGRPKVVRYWRMTAEGGAFVPTAEIDDLRWLSPEEAAGLLTYERDREILRSLSR